MSRFNTWLKAAKKDYKLAWVDQSCFALNIMKESEFQEICTQYAKCNVCANCNNTGTDYRGLLKILGIKP